MFRGEEQHRQRPRGKGGCGLFAELNEAPPHGWDTRWEGLLGGP